LAACWKAGVTYELNPETGGLTLKQKGDFFETYGPFFVADVRDAESASTLWANKLTAHERGKRVKWYTGDEPRMCG